MTPRLYDRLAAGVSVALLLILAGATWFLVQTSLLDAGPADARPPTHDPDYFVEDLVFTRINAHGHPVFRIAANRMVHFPDDRTSEFEHPVMVSLDPDRPRVTVRAERGSTDADGNETLLTGNVVLVREADAGEPAMTIRTDSATIYSETEIARTDRPVRIERGDSVLTGVGMEFNNAARSLQVESRVQLTWQPPPPSR
ncbi:MAG: LPS export ABC transporter periplasmic protein LptC [Burkholderiaceae bacterium]|nr:LPS export ABC transporter periplasmic protein LptC [Burkholderiaceae bacterium]MEB2350511.1 LPS export ABC transporter periplasmic protein LptC [Burkholderiaceae bacterium]